MGPLNGWKDIARHLNRGVRTVQRWEQLGLPIHRPHGAPRSAVFALPEELGAWMSATPVHLADVIANLRAQISALETKVRLLESELQKQPRARARGHSASGK